MNRSIKFGPDFGVRKRAIDDLSHHMTFGKYKGKTLAHVMTKNAGYLIWAHREIRFFMLSKRLLVLAAHYAESQHLLDRDEQYYGEDNDWFWPLDDDVLFGGK